jgi:hypothetical protein
MYHLNNEEKNILDDIQTQKEKIDYSEATMEEIDTGAACFS